jgi:hypothetical protein
MQPFPRGFVWQRRAASIPPGYVPGPIDGLAVADDTAVAHAGDRRRSVTILGLCVSIDGAGADCAATLLEALERGDEAFHGAVDRLAGRFAIVVDEPHRLRFLGDAAAMRSIFYRADFGAVASHARLLTAGERTAMPFQYGFPGNRTPFADVRLLTANTLLDIPRGLTTRRAAVLRYWPRRALDPCTAETAAARVLAWTATAVREAARGRNVRLALTAGLDSRVMLAVVLHSGVPFDTYTYDGGEKTEIDFAVAGVLAARCGLAHAILPCRPPEALRETLNTATYSNHHFRAVEPLADWFGSRNDIAITANLLEIGRAFYAGYAGASPPVTPKAMMALHLTSMTGRVRDLCSAWDGWNRSAREAFRGFMEETGFNAARDILDPFDQFYWEHRMSAWHGLNLLERDFYADAFIPFNARAVWETLLGVPFADRRKSAAFHRIIDLVDPGLSGIPINPKTWPPAGPTPA